jgi:hypothetical protein
MDRIKIGFWLAALYNAGIIVFSKGFSGDLGAVDPLFSPDGCVGVLLWGAAYFALARSYQSAPLVSLVFCLEKAFYGFHWLAWMADHGGEIAAMTEADRLTGGFFSGYGAGDLLFMVFFGWVAWRWRHGADGIQAA